MFGYIINTQPFNKEAKLSRPKPAPDTFAEYLATHKDEGMNVEDLKRSYEFERQLDSIPEPTIKFKPWGRTKASYAAMRLCRG